MNHSHQMIAISLLVLFICSCTSEPGKGTQGETNKGSAQTTQKAGARLPDSPGVYYQSDGETRNLMAKPTVTSDNPSFIIYLEKQVPVEKLRLRLSKYPNSQELLVLKDQPTAGVFEARIEPIENQEKMYRATYPGKLEAGEYISYYFTDESTGKKPWDRAQFKMAGIFPVK